MIGQFAHHYRGLLRDLLRASAEPEVNRRTGVRVAMGAGGASFSLDLSDRFLPTCGVRRTHPATAAAETAWYLTGDKDATFIRRHCKIWDLFLEEDGTVANAYGYRWRRHFGRDQLKLALDALSTDPSDRRVVVSAWDPARDGLGEPARNVPCPVMFTLSLQERTNQLHSTMLLRSSDVFVGLPYDVMGHAMLMDCLAQELGARLGVATFTLAHAHLYEKHWDMAREALEQPIVQPRIVQPGWTASMVLLRPDRFVEEWKTRSADALWPAYNPRPEVIP